MLHVFSGVTVSLTGVTITGGDATSSASGGGILNAGELTITEVAISDNEAGSGGGISNTGTLTLLRSTLSGNSAGLWGGGLSHVSATATVVNSTFSENEAESAGGGIFNHLVGTVGILNSTITNNSAPTAAGIRNLGPPLELKNTIVAGNSATANPDILGTVTSQGNNLIGDDSDTTGWLPTDLLNVPPQLGPLQNNGGPTNTHALLTGSPAIDAGDDTGAPIVDQRGIERPVDGGSGTATVDIGAVERFYGAIHGVRFHDLNEDGNRDPNEPGLAGQTMYLDLNGDTSWNPNEPTAVTAADDPLTTAIDETGMYSITRLAPGSHSVGEVLEIGWGQSYVSYGLAIERASVGEERIAGNDLSRGPSISADGRYIAFNSNSSNLVSGDTNGVDDVFVYDRQTNVVQRISMASDGSQANSDSVAPSISADGRYVAFQSWASNLVPGYWGSPDVFVYDRQTGTMEGIAPGSSYPSISEYGRYVAFGSIDSDLVPGDTNGAYDVFVCDRQSHTIERVSIASDGTQANLGSWMPSVSGNGRYVAFRSEATNLVPDDTNASSDIFVYDRQSDTIELVSIANDGTQGNFDSWYPAISADGWYVALSSEANNLVPDDTNGRRDIFVYNRQSHTIERVSVANDGVQGNRDSWTPAISADGQYIAFVSDATNLVLDDTNASGDTFVYDRQSYTVERISISNDGVQADGASWRNTTSISSDGQTVAYESWASNLVPGDTNATCDVFVRDRYNSTTELASHVWIAAEANAESRSASLSADGRYVAFASDASNLVPGDTNGRSDVFVFDRQTSTTERVSIGSDSTQGYSDSHGSSISADGRYVAFSSWAHNLVPADTGWQDIFVYDRQSRTIEQVSVASDGTQANGNSWDFSISADGQYVVFSSDADNLVPGDTNDCQDIFVYDRQTRTTERVSVANDGTQGNDRSKGPAVSADGRHVAFTSSADNLVPGDTNGLPDVFVYDRQTRMIERVSIASDGTQGNSVFVSPYGPSISADGRHVAFSSSAGNLVPGDTNGLSDVFVFDRQTRTTERVSIASDGTQGNDWSAWPYRPSISADGRYVAFESEATNLVPDDTNGVEDVFVYDRHTNTIERVSVDDDGSEGNMIGEAPSISGGGWYVAFQSAAGNLVSGDNHGAIDIFVSASMATQLPRLYRVALVAGQVVEEIDFGNKPIPGKIHGQKFHDIDGDGFKDDDEPGLADWTIYLDLNDNGTFDAGEPATLTDSHGEYSFTDLEPFWSYTVAEVQQQYWVQTFPSLSEGRRHSVFIDAGTVATGIDFGNHYRGPGGQDVNVISGRSFRDINGNGIRDTGEEGLEGWTVYLDDDDDGELDAGETSTRTLVDNPLTAEVDEAGTYSFVGLSPRSDPYVVRVVATQGWTQTAPRENDFTPRRFGTGDLDQTRSVAAGDFDGDGDADLVVAHGNYVSLMQNDGNGSFVLYEELAVGSGAYAVVAAHLNNDDDLDLAVVNYLSSEMSVLLGVGGGSFAEAVNYPVGIYPSSLAPGDFDGDGDVDLAITNEWDGNVSILRNDGSGSFTADPASPTVGTRPFSVIAGQFNDDNHDGRIDDDDALDLAVANFGDGDNVTCGNVSVLLNNGSGSFETKVNVPAGCSPSSVAAGDLDGDGDLDLAVANFLSDDVSILVNVGNGSFVLLPKSLPAGTGPYALTVADLEGDGDPDLIVTNADEEGLGILRNLTKPGDDELSFAMLDSRGSGRLELGVSFSLIAGDLDDDGVPDLAVANPDENNVSVLLNRVSPGAHRVTLNGLDLAPQLDFGSRTGGITVAPATGLITTEDDGTSSFTVVLDGQPTADVTIGLSPSDPTEGTVSPSSLTFTATDWDLAQMVAVTGVNDDLDDGDVAYTIITAPATSGDPNYNGLDATDVSVTNQDDADTAGIAVSPASGLITTEAGGTAHFTVVLDSQPTAEVTIGLSSDDTSEGTVSPASLSFPPDGWSEPQTVVVTGVDDWAADGDVSYTILVAAAISSDPNYADLDPPDVAVANQDDGDIPGITMSLTSGLTTTETGGMAQFTVVLDSQPTADVTIGVSSSDLTEGTVSPLSLTFTSGNWNRAQPVMVTGVDDEAADEHVAYIIVTAPATSGDSDYNGLNATDVSVTNIDDDTPSVLVIQTDGWTNVSEGKATDTYEVALTSQPTADVVITLMPGGQLSVVPAELTFDLSDWDTSQTVTVTATDDDVDEGLDIQTIVHSSSSADAAYDGIPVSNVRVSITDNDSAGVLLMPSPGLTSLTEGGAGDGYDVLLTSEPVAIVVITVITDAQLDTAPTMLTFTPANWDVKQTVTARAVDDNVHEGDHSSTITHIVTSADGNYDGIDVDELTVNIIDKDAVVFEGRIVTAYGTEADDLFEFTRDDTLTITLNGVTWEFAAVDVDKVVFNGAGGLNTALVTGSDDDETVTLGTNSASLVGTGLDLQANDVTIKTFTGGGGADVANLYGSENDDTLDADPSEATLSGDGYTVRAIDFPTVNVFAGEGGHDIAVLEDSADDDLFNSTVDSVELGGPSFLIHTESFQEVHAYARNGGNDTASFTDSPGNDKFKAEPDEDYVKMYGSAMYNRAKFFETVVATASQGGNDLARIFDSRGDDTFIAMADESHFYNDNTDPFDLTVQAFDRVIGYSYVGGQDRVEMHDSALEDVFMAKPHKVEIYDRATQGDVYKVTARKFEHRQAVADFFNGGEDIAKIWDTPGDDVLKADYLPDGDTWATLSTVDGEETDELYEAIAFEIVKGYGTTGKNVRDLGDGVDFTKWWGLWEDKH